MATILLNGSPVNVISGCTLSQAIHEYEQIDTPCGCKGRCGKCKVFAKGDLSEISESERKFLSNDEIENGIRLACYTIVNGDCEVKTFEKTKSHVLLNNNFHKNSGNAIFSKFAIAIDIGTTTIAGCLYSTSGDILAKDGFANPQSRWGADVISRIDSALHGEAEKLAECIQNAINQLVYKLVDNANINIDDIDCMIIAGNTAMLYLLTKISPLCLSHAPFEVDHFFGEFVSAQTLNLSCKNATVYLPRCISAFVGADTTVAILASEITTNRSSVKMLVDIGTNGEVALWNNGKLLCCSTAAGPAFEGAGITMGMNGKDGAIDHVFIENNQIKAHVLGDIQPIGICGSGIIDALSCFLEKDLMDENGFLSTDPTTVYKNVAVYQKDVRSIQLAKSAISAGITTLIKSEGLNLDDIDMLAIAGGFGSYLDVKNAGKIGLIPNELTNKVNVLGNAVLKGAGMILFDKNMLTLSENLAKCATTIDLSTSQTFFQEYTENMYFY